MDECVCFLLSTGRRWYTTRPASTVTTFQPISCSSHLLKELLKKAASVSKRKKKRNMQQKLLEQHKNLFLWAKIDDEKSSVSCGRRVTAIEATQTTNAWLVKCADWNGFTFSHTLRGFFCCCYVLLAPFSSAENSVEVSLSLSLNDNSVISAR